MSLFEKATREQSKLRMAIQGAAGFGKTKSALKIAEQFGTVAVIDSERGSSRLYSGVKDRGGHEFDVVEVADPQIQKALPKPGFHPDNAIFLLDMAAKDHDVVVIDSGSHFWNGPGGFLELVTEETQRMQSKGQKPDSFAAWKNIDPIYKRFVNALLNCPAHVIVCLRAKQEYDRKDGKVIKLGMAPEFRDNFQYEMSIEGMLDADHNLVIGKTRCEALDGRIFNKPGKDLADIIKNWLNDGAPATPKTVPAMPAAIAAAAAAPTEAAPANDGGVSLWTTKINETKSVTELRSLGGLLKGLSTPVQVALSQPYREHMKAMETVVVS